ncbi:MAG TPA: SprB repeat-containing protein, partial [Roseivirga sp.]
MTRYWKNILPLLILLSQVFWTSPSWALDLNDPGNTITVEPANVQNDCNDSVAGPVNLVPDNGITPYLPWEYDKVDMMSPASSNKTKATKFACDDFVFWDETKDQSDEQPPNCFGGNDGSIRLQISNSEFNQTEYTFYDPNGNIVPKKNRFEIENLISGTYRVVATTSIKGGDGTVCTYETTITVPEAEKRFNVNTDSAVKNVSCNGNDGEINLEVTGALDSNNLKYDWTDITGTDDPSVRTGLSAGEYEVRITETTNGVEHCEVYKFTVNAFAAIVISPTITSPTCKGEAQGAITLSLSGGSGTYSKFLWKKGGVEVTNLKDIPNPSGLLAGDYTVEVEDSNGCKQTSNTITITEPANALTVSLNTSANVNCKGGSDGSIDINVTGGTPFTGGTYTYSWKKDDSSISATTQDLTGLTKGSYEITVTDATGCSQTFTKEIEEPNTNITAKPLITNVSCNGLSNGKII